MTTKASSIHADLPDLLPGNSAKEKNAKKLSSFEWHGAKPIPTLVLLLVGGIFWLQSPPDGLTVQAWHLLIIFLGTIFAVILKPLPTGAISMVAITLCIGTSTLSLADCLSSFSSSVAWLVVMAFFMALGFKTTGLGTRIAYFFVMILGRSTVGLSYGLILTELLLAPFIPSNTARGAGIIFPIITALAQEQGSDPKKGTRKKVGAFLIQVCFQTNLITSAMFLTGLVGNPLVVSLAQASGVTITWGGWAVAAIIPGMINLLLLPLVIYKIYPPTLKVSEGAQDQARARLKELGGLKVNEVLMISTFFVVLILWVFGEAWGVHATAAAMIGLSVLLLTGVLKWQDCVKEKEAWETLMWFAPLLMMATFLTKFGMMDWFSKHVQSMVASFSLPLTFAIVTLVYFYVQYFFASVTARITALYGAFLTVLIAAGAPPEVSAMLLAVLSALAGSLTHFGTATAPVYFGAGYVTVQEWWRNSFIMSVVNLAVWGGFGALWWKILGLW